MTLEIRPFTEEMLPLAGQLLAQRHKRNREKFPLLPARFEEPRGAEAAVRSSWQGRLKRGYAAFRDGKMIGYLIGEHVVQPWGRCGYVYLPGYALADGESTIVLQDLYACLGDDWVRLGVFSHGVYVSAADASIVQALFDIGFGKERVDAMLDLRTLEIPKLEDPANITIRRAGKDDNEHLGNLSHIIMDALSNPPYWHPTIPEDYPELREGWSELVDDAEWKVWLALEKDEALGCVGFVEKKENETDMLASPKTVYLSVAATTQKARGRGIANVLTWRGLEEARRNGYEICYTNWISPNFLASRYWPRFGFKDVAYRLSKRVDPMIAGQREGASNQIPNKQKNHVHLLSSMGINLQ
jgi:predicted GNAT family acetyltransferase